ncbi:type VII secretion protein EccE [Kutzneria viridogrisea]|uniref:Type VII secretion protein EccE n=1 Tax=Kutzneria viridogrisea TaxID=47990 RepID=A0ABR6B8F5_9PSEU|nr:type VII secretion protein EccE [Kutzneria viridogrisea]
MSSAVESTVQFRKVGTRRRTVKAGWLRPVGAGQVAVWQVAALAVLATAIPLGPTGIAVIVLAVLAVALTSVRSSGLCLYQWLLVRLGHAGAQRAVRRLAPQQDPIAAVLPGLTVHRHVDRAGNRVGVARVDDSWITVVRLLSEPDTPALIEALRAAHSRADIPLAGAQLVVWAAPAPTAVGPGPVEPVRIHWLALRYRPADAPGATLARGGGTTGAERAAASAALGLVGRLAEAGQAGAVLDEPELRQDLLVALGTDPRAFAGATPGSRPEVKVEQSWRTWSIGRLHQACFAPAGNRAAVELLGELVPGSEFTCTSFRLGRTPGGTVEASTGVRIGFQLKHAPRRLDRVLRGLAGDLVPLNGRHGNHVLRTLPLALD